MNGQDSKSPQLRIMTIKKTPQRTLRHLRTFGQIAGIAIITAILYLAFFEDKGTIGQYYTFVRWLTLIGGALAIWWLIRDWLINENGSWTPTWSWGNTFPDAWEKARREWSGIITIEKLLLLKKFRRIEGIA